MGDLCSVADVAAFLQVAIDPDDDSVLAAIAEASASARNYCCQVIDLVTDDEYTFDVPPGRPILFLPELPVVSVASVTEDGDVLTAGRNDDYLLGRQGQLYRIGRDWVDGPQQVTVIYTHGIDPDYDLSGLPDDLRGVVARAAARRYQAGLRAANTDAISGLQSTTIGDYSVTYGSEQSGGASGAMLGASAANMLLLSEKSMLDWYKYKGLAGTVG
jgi:hypothetical protein